MPPCQPFGFPMSLIHRSLLALRQACLWLAVLGTFLLFAIVAFNIVARTVFDATGGEVNLMISGAIELSQYALMISIFAAIPAMLGTGLIRVDILSKRFPIWLQGAVDRLWLALFAVFAAILAHAFWDFAATALERGDQTQDLRWPLWPFYGIAALECGALVVLAAAEAIGLMATREAEQI